jgi:hypothetical protein
MGYKNSVKGQQEEPKSKWSGYFQLPGKIGSVKTVIRNKPITVKQLTN